MRVSFRGVRGSVPWTSVDGIAHGCNTPCIEITDERTSATLVLDAGSGIVGVTPPSGSRVALLFSHYHWDHVLGLPYFAPLFDPSSRVSLHAPALPGYDPSWLARVFGVPFHPVPYDAVANHPEPSLVSPGPVVLEGFTVTAAALNHPGGAFAYRIGGDSGDFVYATDHEFGDPIYDEALGALVAGAAAVVLDSHFTPEELPRHAGWGHGDWHQCAEFAAAHEVGALYLFHHRPGRRDAELDTIQASARRIFPRAHTAREGTVLEL